MPDLTTVVDRSRNRKVLGLAVLCGCVALAVVAAASKGDDAHTVRLAAELPQAATPTDEVPSVGDLPVPVPPSSGESESFGTWTTEDLASIGLTLEIVPGPAPVTEEQAIAIALGKSPGTAIRAVLAQVHDTSVTPQIHQLMWVVVVKWSYPVPQQGGPVLPPGEHPDYKPLPAKEYTIDFIDAKTGEWVQGLE